MSKKRAVVICPGRGSYTKDNLGTLPNRKSIQLDLQQIDQDRKDRGYPTVTELDGAEKFKVSVHTKGEHASPLIYTCAKADFLEINQDQIEISAIAGNSMGWYLSLAFAGALDPKDSFHLIQTMGAMMEKELIGGQVIYPIVDENWRIDPERITQLEKKVQEINAEGDCEVYTSIHLGGYKVLAGNKKGVSRLLEVLPKQDPYPFQLVNHGAFHTPLLKEISETAEHALYRIRFQKPTIPMIDGRGHIWSTYATNSKDLYDYTLGHQVTETYDFTKSIEVALKEFAPDLLILLGPGNSLGGAIGQILIENDWLGLRNKSDFQERQKQQPFLISMGVPEQASLVK